MFLSNKIYRIRFEKRCIEYFGFEIILSFIFALLIKIGIIPQATTTYAAITGIIIIANTFFQFFRIRRCFWRTMDKTVYFKINLTIFIAFAILNLSLAFYNVEPLYTYLFLGFKLGTVFNLSKFVSALAANIILLLIIIIIPLKYELSVLIDNFLSNSKLYKKATSKNGKMPFLIKRFIEYFLPEVILSAVFALLFNMNILLQTRALVSVVTSVILIISTWYQIYCLKEYLKFVNDITPYLKTNLIVFMIFAVLNLTLAYFNVEPIYTFLFLPYKLGMLLGLSKLSSAAIINGIMLLIILIVPYTVPPKIVDIPDEDDLELLRGSGES